VSYCHGTLQVHVPETCMRLSVTDSLQLHLKQFKAPCGASLKSWGTIWLWTTLELIASLLYSLYPIIQPTPIYNGFEHLELNYGTHRQSNSTRAGRYRGQLHSAGLHSRWASTWQRTARNMSSSQGRHSLVSAAAKPYSSRARSSRSRNSGWSREDTLTTYRLSASPTYTTVWPLGTSLGMAASPSPSPPSSWAHPALAAVSAAASLFHACRKALRLRNLLLCLDPAFMPACGHPKGDHQVCMCGNVVGHSVYI
jgi:hypothetical protein